MDLNHNIFENFSSCNGDIFKNIKAVLMITTDKVYFNKEKNYLYNENDKLGGHDPYSASKAASEIAIESFQKSFFNKRNKPYIATARAGNIIGGGDWSEDRLIPDLFKSYLKIKPEYR
jgi:CDP-glucose 4,6-dehydratase